MARPVCCRRIGFLPEARYFKPAGIRLERLEEVLLSLDELEALRLADFCGLYQEQAAESMGISRPTFSRIVEQARRKVAEALVLGKALRLAGGSVSLQGEDAMRQRRRQKHGLSQERGREIGASAAGRGMGRGPCGRGDRRGRRREGDEPREPGRGEPVRPEVQESTTLSSDESPSEAQGKEMGKEKA